MRCPDVASLTLCTAVYANLAAHAVAMWITEITKKNYFTHLERGFFPFSFSSEATAYANLSRTLILQASLNREIVLFVFGFWIAA